MKGKSPANKIKTLAYISDGFVLVVRENSTCAHTCKCTEAIPKDAVFISHKNLCYAVVLSLFFASSLQFTLSTNVMRARRRLRLKEDHRTLFLSNT